LSERIPTFGNRMPNSFVLTMSRTSRPKVVGEVGVVGRRDHVPIRAPRHVVGREATRRELGLAVLRRREDHQAPRLAALHSLELLGDRAVERVGDVGRLRVLGEADQALAPFDAAHDFGRRVFRRDGRTRGRHGPSGGLRTVSGPMNSPAWRIGLWLLASRAKRDLDELLIGEIGSRLLNGRGGVVLVLLAEQVLAEEDRGRRVLVRERELLPAQRDLPVRLPVFPGRVGFRVLAEEGVQRLLGDAEDGRDFLLGAEQLRALEDGAQRVLVGLQNGPALLIRPGCVRMWFRNSSLCPSGVDARSCSACWRAASRAATSAFDGRPRFFGVSVMGPLVSPATDQAARASSSGLRTVARQLVGGCFTPSTTGQ
jgi:hypothetical protein